MSDWISYEALLTEGYRRCAKLTWRYGTTYFWAAALLPKPQRKHVHAIKIVAAVDTVVYTIVMKRPSEPRPRITDLLRKPGSQHPTPCAPAG